MRSLRLGTKVCHPHESRCGAAVDEFETHGQPEECRQNSPAAINDIIIRRVASVHVLDAL